MEKADNKRPTLIIVVNRTRDSGGIIGLAVGPRRVCAKAKIMNQRSKVKQIILIIMQLYCACASARSRIVWTIVALCARRVCGLIDTGLSISRAEWNAFFLPRPYLFLWLQTIATVNYCRGDLVCAARCAAFTDRARLLSDFGYVVRFFVFRFFSLSRFFCRFVLFLFRVC